MWFLLPRYLLNLSHLLKPHPVLGHLRRTSTITTRSMVILSLSIANYSLSNLPARTLHSNLFELLLLLLLNSHLKAPLLNIPYEIFKPFYSNFSHIQIMVNPPHKLYLSPLILLHHGILILPVATI